MFYKHILMYAVFNQKLKINEMKQQYNCPYDQS